MATSIETKIANETKELLIKACTYSTTTKHLDTWQKGEILDNDVKDIPEKFGNIIKFPTSYSFTRLNVGLVTSVKFILLNC